VEAVQAERRRRVWWSRSQGPGHWLRTDHRDLRFNIEQLDERALQRIRAVYHGFCALARLDRAEGRKFAQ
jgi:hypothetical protein